MMHDQKNIKRELERLCVNNIVERFNTRYKGKDKVLPVTCHDRHRERNRGIPLPMLNFSARKEWVLNLTCAGIAQLV